MIIKFENIGKILPSELLMIIKIYEELQEARNNRAFSRDPYFIVSNNEENNFLEINIKLERADILKHLNCSIKTTEK